MSGFRYTSGDTRRPVGTRAAVRVESLNTRNSRCNPWPNSLPGALNGGPASTGSIRTTTRSSSCSTNSSPKTSVRRASPDAPKDGVLATMDALIEHTRRHFLAEEAFLRQIRFPGYNEHRCEHVLQTAEFADMRRALGQEPGPVLGSETLQDLKRWFFNHVIAEDRAYVDYYRSAIETGLPA